MAEDNDIIARLKVEGQEKFKADLLASSKSADTVTASITKMEKAIESATDPKDIKRLTDELEAVKIASEAGATAFESSKAKLRQYKEEASGLATVMATLKSEGKQNTQTFKDIQKEFESTKRKAGDLQDKISDINQEIKNLGSDTRGIDNVVRGVSLVANTYQLAAGATALFGKENKNLEQALIKINGVMAVTQSLQQIGNELTKEDSILKRAAAASMKIYSEAVDFVKNGTKSGILAVKESTKAYDGVGDAVKTASTGTTLLTTAQKAHETATKASTIATSANTAAVASSSMAMQIFRFALLATGIGVFVVGVSLLVKNWDKLKESIFGATQSLEEFRKKQDEIRQANKKSFDDYETEIKYLVNINKLTQEAADLKLSIKRKEAEETLKTVFDENKKKLEEYETAIRNVTFAKDDGLTLSELEHVRSRQKYIPTQKQLAEQKRITTEAELDYKRAVNDRIATEEKGVAVATKAKEIKAEKLKQDIEELQLLESFDANSQRAIKAQIDWYTEMRSNIDMNSQAFKDLTEIIDLLQKKLAGKQKVNIDTSDALSGLSRKDTSRPLTLFERIFGTAEQNANAQKRTENYAKGSLKIISELSQYGQQISSIAEQAIQIRSQNELAMLEDKKNRGLITEKEYEKQSAAIKNEAAQKKRKIDIANAIAQIPVAVLSAYIAGLQIGGPAAPIVAGILAGVAGAFGLAQVALISSAPLPKFRDGGSVAKRLGLIKGAKHEQGGVPIEVEGDEFVVKSQATKKYGVKMLDDINNLRFNPIINAGNKISAKRHSDMRLYENLSTISSYLKQGYKIDAKGNEILKEISGKLRNKSSYV